MGVCFRGQQFLCCVCTAVGRVGVAGKEEVPPTPRGDRNSLWWDLGEWLLPAVSGKEEPRQVGLGWWSSRLVFSVAPDPSVEEGPLSDFSGS